jgi:hypothetical protein
VPPPTFTIPAYPETLPPPPYRASTNCSVEVPEPVPKLIWCHWPGAESDDDVNVIRWDDVPTADNDPFTVSEREDAFPFTTTPASIVNVTPDATVTFPVITYGLFASVHVVFDEIVPDTFVGPEPNAGRTTTASATETASAASSREGERRPMRGRCLSISP